MRRTIRFAAGRRVFGLLAVFVIVFWSTTPAQAQSPHAGCASETPWASRPLGPSFVVVPPVLSPSASTAWVPLRAEVYRSDLEKDDAPLQLIVPERVLNRLLTDERRESGPVRDVILGAQVFGRQTTVIRAQFDCRPSRDQAEVHLVLQGVVHSDTVGLTPQAAVNTWGRHGVFAVKPVMFDGRQIMTRRAAMWVDVHNQYVAASTPFEGVPLLDAIARGTALSSAELQRPQADAETAARLVSQLGREFNRQTDRQLAQLNRRWRDELQTKFGDVWPEQLSLRTTESQLLLSAAWADTPSVDGALRDPNFASRSDAATVDDSITLRVHESAINAWLRRSSLAGKTYSETQLRNLFESFVANLGGRIVVKEETPTAALLVKPALIRLADRDPVIVKLEDSRLLLTIRASVEVAGQTVLAQDDITVPLSWNGQSDVWLVHAGPLAFAKADEGVSLFGMIATLVRGQLAAMFPDIELPKSIELPASETPLKSLRLEKAEASSGWLRLSLGVEKPAAPSTESSIPRTTTSAREVHESSARARSRRNG